MRRILAATVSGTVAAALVFGIARSQDVSFIGKVDILGNRGAILDFAGQNAAAPANSLLTGCEFNTSPTAITSGSASPIQCDNAGDTLVKVNTALPSGGNTIGAVTQASGPWTSNVTQFGGTNISTGTGAGGVGIPRVTISNDSSLAANQSVNLAQVGGASTSTAASGTLKVGITGNGAATLDAAVGAASAPTNMLAVGGVFNSSPLSLANGQSSALQVDSTGVLKTNCFVNCGVAQGSTTASETGSLVMGAVTTSAPSYTTAQTSPLSLDTTGNLRALAMQSTGNGTNTSAWLTEGGCAGQTIANTSVTPINNAGSSSNLKLVSKVSSKQVYICSIDIVAGAATNVALVEGTKTTNECDTSTAGMAGGATAATGWNLGANGGLTKGNGVGVVFRTAIANHDVCLLFSAGNQVSGSVTWAQF
jgi:hypothetical protein